MKKSKLLFLLSLFNFMAVFVCILLLPNNVPFEFINALIVNHLVSKWYNIIIPVLQLISCLIILIVDIKEEGKYTHTYRYLITYVAISLAMVYTWIMIAIQFGNYAVGDKINFPISVLVLTSLSLLMMAYGFYQMERDMKGASIFNFKWVKNNPIVWKKTHIFAGRMNIFCGVVVFVLALCNYILLRSNWIHVLVLSIWFVFYYMLTLLHSIRLKKYYTK